MGYVPIYTARQTKLPAPIRPIGPAPRRRHVVTQRRPALTIGLDHHHELELVVGIVDADHDAVRGDGFAVVTDSHPGLGSEVFDCDHRFCLSLGDFSSSRV